VSDGVAKRELLVGVDHAPPAPLCFGLPGTPDFRGFEIDMLGDIAGRLGVTLRFTSALWSAILADLQAGRIDLICAAATITEERRLTVSFTDPYLESSLALATRSDDAGADPGQLGGRRVGVRVATVAEEYVRGHCASGRVETFDLNVRQYEALRDRDVDVVVDDAPIAAHFARSVAGLRLGPRIAGTAYQYGIVVAHGNDRLRTALNRALEDMRRAGVLEELQRRWLEAG
jgi:L-cystine transport system substrate-binding protein